MTLTRRLLLCGLLAGAAPLRAAPGTIGRALGVEGAGWLTRAGLEQPLAPALDLSEGDLLRTDAASRAEIELYTRTRLILGEATRLHLDRYIADVGGEIRVEGALLFDRPEELAPLDLTLQTPFARIGVRGTRFVVAVTRGLPSVFVERGAVEVSAAGRAVALTAGEGVDFPLPDGPPGEVVTWGAGRIAEAYAAVGEAPPG